MEVLLRDIRALQRDVAINDVTKEQIRYQDEWNEASHPSSGVDTGVGQAANSGGSFGILQGFGFSISSSPLSLQP